MTPIDILIRVGLGVAAWAALAALALASWGSLREASAELRQRYVNSVGESLKRTRVLEDVPTWGRLLEWMVAAGPAARTGKRLVVALVLGSALAITMKQPTLACLCVAALVGFPWLLAHLISWILRARTRTIERQLPDAIMVMVGSLRAGLTLEHALRSVGGAMSGPIATEARLCVAEITAGATAGDALGRFARRIPSEHVGMFVAASRVHLAHGGDLTAALESLGRAITRIQLSEAELAARTAGARREARVVTAAPFAILPLGVLMDPEMFGRLFGTPPGWIILLIAGAVWAYSARQLHRISTREV